MSYIEMPARPAAVISLCLALGSSVAWPLAGHAQTVVAPTTFNLQIQFQRMNAAPHHPERGEVTLDELTSMGANQPQLPLDRHLSIFVTDVENGKPNKVFGGDGPIGPGQAKWGSLSYKDNSFSSVVG